ncbi:MAG: hypothetical protein ACC682_10545, partial [Gemmatimonadota bacterium]
MTVSPPGAQNGDRLEILFERASRLPGPARERLLDQVRADDPEVAAEILSLLDAGSEAGTFFQTLGKTLFSGDDDVTDP